MRRTNMSIGCLYCGLQLPDSANFCPECGRPIERGFKIRPIQESEAAIRVESGGKIRRTNMSIGCLYCGLQLPDSANFCPECGRPIERGFKIRPIQESEAAIRVESGGKIRRTNMSIGCLYCGLQLPDSANFCPECGRPIERGFKIRPIQESEAAIRVESGGKIRRTNMSIGCLYCGLQLPDSANFCPECGRPIERGFKIRPIQESELD